MDSRHIARWVSRLRLGDIAPDVKAFARSLVLDNLGCQVAGATLPWSRAYYDAVSSIRDGGTSTVAYFGTKLPVDEAAFVNSAFNHANESDDTHLKSPTHAGAVAVPAALALAEHVGASGADFLCAVIAAYEVHTRIAYAASPHLHSRGHHPPVACGPFGSAAAASVLLKLDEQQTQHALAIAGSHSAGLMEYANSGGSVKRMHTGIAAQAGIRAALFAKAGITGPAAILEGEKGFFKVFAGAYDRERLLDDLGSRYTFMDTAIKPYACAHPIHESLDTLDKIRAQTPFGAEDVEAITAYASSERFAVLIGSIIEPEDILGAQFSGPFSLSMRLHSAGCAAGGGNGFWDYANLDPRDPSLRATARKIRYIPPKTAGVALDRGQGLEVRLVSGRILIDAVAFSKGLPENPLSSEEVEAKFFSLADAVLAPGQARALSQSVAELERLNSIHEMSELLSHPNPLEHTESGRLA